MHEIGGYFEMEENKGKEYHEGALALDSGRNALAYLVEAAGYDKVHVPEYSCDTILQGVRKAGATVETYTINDALRPDFRRGVKNSEAVLIINYYGQIENKEIKIFKERYGNIIVDNTQAFFQMPVKGIDTIYSCRKFFGVADGAYLFTNKRILRNLEEDVSADRMLYVLGRYDEYASKYYELSVRNNERFDKSPIRLMSRVTHNILRGIDYKFCSLRRYENAVFLHKSLKKINAFNMNVPDGAFMYPLYLPEEDTLCLRKFLHKRLIFVPCLWPEVVNHNNSELGKRLSLGIVPLPCDHRYNLDEMNYIVKCVFEFFNKQ